MSFGPKVPPWVPDVDPPNALTAPRGMWLRQQEALDVQRHPQLQAGSRLSLPVGFGMRAYSDAAAYNREGAAGWESASSDFNARSRRKSEALFAAQLTMFGGGEGMDSDSSADSLVSTPRVSVVEEEESDGSRLDQILQGLELNVAPTMQVSPVNFVDDAVLDLPTREFAQFLKTVDPQTATAIKAARRRKKNREYAKGSRERRRERPGGSSPREGNSPRNSGAFDDQSLPATPMSTDAFAGFDGFERKFVP